MNKKKYILIIGGIVLGILLLLGGTLAYFRYFRSGLVNSNLTSGEISLDYTEGVSTISLSNAFPESDYQGMNSENSFTFDITGNEDNPDTLIEYVITAVYGDEVEGRTRFDDDAIKLYLTNTNGDILYLDNPSDLSTGELLYKNYIRGSSEVTHNYTLKMWIGDNVIITDTPDAYDLTSNRVYTTSAYRNLYASVKINVDAYEIIEANVPSLDDGMIPIRYNESTHQWVKADKTNTNNDWYDYTTKTWANVVLVTDSTRADYLNDTTIPVGTPITEADILAYFVWIPRYKYKLFNADTVLCNTVIEVNSTDYPECYTENVLVGSNLTFPMVDPQEIEIEFEKGIETTGVGYTNGTWLTHPAFTFGSDELTGIWVAKFETTGDATTPTSIPNVVSLRNQNVSTQFITSLKFAGGTLTDGIVEFIGNTTYGLTENTDSHMMKNTEWGAVAYLSHSKYGMNSEIYINNAGYYNSLTGLYEGMITGRSGGNVGGSVTPTEVGGTTQYISGGYYTYDGKCATTSSTVPSLTECVDTTSFLIDITKGTSASTTGNIYGIYDMSGGAFEYVMGVIQDTNYPALPRSGFRAARNSGFKGMLSSGDIYSPNPEILFPNSKYYDLYGTSRTSRILGDATMETAVWYKDIKNWLTTTYPWFLRGGGVNNGTFAGAFLIDGHYGSVGSNSSFRVVLAR